VKTPRYFANHRPVFGSAVFVRGAAFTSCGHAQAIRLALLASKPQFDRDEDCPLPGEARA